jgi:hypothetical protein
MFTVRVIRGSTGSAISNEKVFVSFDSIFRGWLEQRTDEKGEAHFDADPGRGKVIVRGSTLETYLGGTVTVHV